MTEAWYREATKRPMPYAGRLPNRQDVPAVILHTNGGGTDNGSLYGWFSRAGNDICSHFQVAKDGRVEQYVPRGKQAYAQFSGNAFAVSIETEDDGHPDTPWTAAQVAAIVGICQWLNVPAKLLAVTGAGGGVGWHEQYADWNRNGHVCPGKVREKQIRKQILPALAGVPATKPPKPLRFGPVRRAAVRYMTRVFVGLHKRGGVLGEGTRQILLDHENATADLLKAK